MTTLRRCSKSPAQRASKQAVDTTSIERTLENPTRAGVRNGSGVAQPLALLLPSREHTAVDAVSIIEGARAHIDRHGRRVAHPRRCMRKTFGERHRAENGPQHFPSLAPAIQALFACKILCFHTCWFDLLALTHKSRHSCLSAVWPAARHSALKSNHTLGIFALSVPEQVLSFR
jgi:hypothetical protein